MSERTVTIHGDEWKWEHVRDSIEWCRGHKWTFQKWTSKHERWDHDHCMVCWWKLRESSDPQVSHGYTDEEEYQWLCQECYEQFVKPSAVGGI